MVRSQLAATVTFTPTTIISSRELGELIIACIKVYLIMCLFFCLLFVLLNMRSALSLSAATTSSGAPMVFLSVAQVDSHWKKNWNLRSNLVMLGERQDINGQAILTWWPHDLVFF